MGGRCELNWRSLRERVVADACEHDNEHAGSINCGVCIDLLALQDAVSCAAWSE